MARPVNPNHKDTKKEIEFFFKNNFHRGHRRYTYIEFADNKQQAIDRFKLKIIILKDMGVSFLTQCLNFSKDEANQLVEDYPLRTLELAEAEATNDIEPELIKIDPTLSNKEILEELKEIRINLDLGKGLYKTSSERDFGTKLADTLYILDCKKFYLTNEYIKTELDKYNGYEIKLQTIKKYFNYAYEEYLNIPI